MQKVGANDFEKSLVLSVKSRLNRFCKKPPNGYETPLNGYGKTT